MIAPDRKFTTLLPLSEIDVGVPEVGVKWFEDPDLSLHCVTFEPESIIEDKSVESNHSWQPDIEVGEKAPTRLMDGVVILMILLESKDLSLSYSRTSNNKSIKIKKSAIYI